MIPALTLILCFQLVGEVASRGLNLPLPGPVVGLVLLVFACSASPALVQRLRPVAQSLLSHLSLFFVPAGVGVVTHMPTIAQHGIGIGIALAVSTVLAIAAGALTFAAVARLIGTPDD
ncbi:CidA/LrgA family protein [Paracoccus aerodenitrificans]|uniref:CidA/LrgA family protein n=1 Tax=Paracoccus aerodenitrificans TaxID=3017781 RepID=UPI0022F0918E|nr:CidA/LrgA family protein [Paracoccus aerodenitrificans]WBU63000.1 CidA/LrgA family protein [Paracoccus aerodenitrificans]